MLLALTIAQLFGRNPRVSGRDPSGWRGVGKEIALVQLWQFALDWKRSIVVHLDGRRASSSLVGLDYGGSR